MTSDNSNTGVEITALKSQVFAQLVALVVISGTFMVFLYRQASIASKDEEQLTATLTQTETAMGNFVGNLAIYSHKHPEFVPLLKKYGIDPGLVAVPAAPKK